MTIETSECYERLHLQWHVTDRCNLRCTHCYQENYSAKNDLTFEELLIVLGEYNSLLELWSQTCPSNIIPGHITITGGEPFIRPDFLTLLQVLANYKNDFTFSILSNGTLIDATIAKALKKRGVGYVQISIEGSEKTHDQIRGQGSFQKAIRGLKFLIQENVRTLISFTAHQKNFLEFSEVAQMGCELGAWRVWADRLIPCGQGTSQQTLSKEGTEQFFDIMLKARMEAEKNYRGKTHIAMHRALQFLKSNETPYYCHAGNSFITIDANGDLYPCRRMPIKIGNVLETDLIDLYEEDKLLQKLRVPDTHIEGCQNCQHVSQCRGGLRCLSYAVHHDCFKADPGCWLASDVE